MALQPGMVNCLSRSIPGLHNSPAMCHAGPQEHSRRSAPASLKLQGRQRGWSARGGICHVCFRSTPCGHQLHRSSGRARVQHKRRAKSQRRRQMTCEAPNAAASSPTCEEVGVARVKPLQHAQQARPEECHVIVPNDEPLEAGAAWRSSTQCLQWQGRQLPGGRLACWWASGSCWGGAARFRPTAGPPRPPQPAQGRRHR